jgi:peptidoglycan/xylan/chitin deacetylase (PgdA/CDA1 family)
MPFWKSLLLNLYYYATCPGRWSAARRRALEGRAPLVVLFYHRVADDGAGEETCSNRVFARQIRWLAGHFDMISLAEVQRRIRTGNSPRPAVHVTFDDGYAENCQQAIPLLVKMHVPCTYFVTAGNVFCGRPFDHDVARGRRFPPNTLEQLRAMAAAGIEIGAHTRSHADLGGLTDLDRLNQEVVVAGQELRAAIGRPVRYFAFPFGQYMNLSSDVFHLARQAGYEAVCSAYGGYNFPGSDPFHVQRIHADGDMIRLKNHATVDPRKLGVPPFVYQMQPEIQNA